MRCSGVNEPLLQLTFGDGCSEPLYPALPLAPDGLIVRLTDFRQTPSQVAPNQPYEQAGTVENHGIDEALGVDTPLAAGSPV